MAHYFTQAEAEFIRQRAHARSNVELTELFNAHFSMDLGVNQIKAYKKNHKITSGLDGRYKPGSVPFNKGKKGLTSANKTSFTKGYRPHNYLPIGTTRVNGDDYVDIKVADPNKWKGKHILIWEEHNGPAPKGYAVIFGDGDNRNFDSENLLLVSRKQLVRMNQRGLIRDDVELTKVGITIADICNRIGERKRCSHGRI